MTTFREEHRREALMATVIIHAALAAAFVFTVFRGPDPPLTELGGDGVELNYGVDEAGDGDIQSLATANNSRNREDSRPPAATPDPQPRPVQPQATPQPTVRTPPTEERVVTSEAEESPVTVPPVTRPAKPREPVRETREVKEVAAVPTPTPPAEKPRTLYTPRGSNTGGGNGVNGTSNAATGNNNGDRPGSVGDQGDPSGSLDAKALYGKPGSGGSGSSPGSGGSGLEMSGWAFASTPRAAPIDNESGTVRFRIRINEEGDVESVQKVSGTVTPAQEKLCRDALLNASFRRTTSATGGATGYYTFRITVR